MFGHILRALWSDQREVELPPEPQAGAMDAPGFEVRKPKPHPAKTLKAPKFRKKKPFVPRFRRVERPAQRRRWRDRETE